MLIKILCNKLLLGRATSQLASCTEPSRAGSLFSRARKTGSARARSERRAGPSRAELLRARASSSSSSFFPALGTDTLRFATRGRSRSTWLRPSSHPLALLLQGLITSLRRRSLLMLAQRPIITTKLPLLPMWTSRLPRCKFYANSNLPLASLQIIVLNKIKSNQGTVKCKCPLKKAY
jgi:hypothetical protein